MFTRATTRLFATRLLGTTAAVMIAAITLPTAAFAECRWFGTPPACRGSCPGGWQQERSRACKVGFVRTGTEVYCCRVTTGKLSQPLEVAKNREKAEQEKLEKQRLEKKRQDDALREQERLQREAQKREQDRLQREAQKCEQDRLQREAQARDQQRQAALQAERDRQQREAAENTRRLAEADRAAAADRERQRQQTEARQRQAEADRRQAEADRREQQRQDDGERRQREQRVADAGRNRDDAKRKSNDDNSLLPPEPATSTKSAAAARKEPARKSDDTSLLPPESESSPTLGRTAGAAAAGAAAIASLASRGDGTGRTIWMHNNSQMALSGAGDQMKFAYEKPRSGLSDIGINTGTTLFTGSRKGGSWTGEAITFSRRCGQLKFEISGTESSDGKKVELRGRKPNLDGSCNVSGHRDEVLVFERFETVVR